MLVVQPWGMRPCVSTGAPRDRPGIAGGGVAPDPLACARIVGVLPASSGQSSSRPSDGLWSRRGLERGLSSITRAIPCVKGEDCVREILSRADTFIPFAYRPTKASLGDFITLVFCGVIVGRARISRIDPAHSSAPGKSQRHRPRAPNGSSATREGGRGLQGPSMSRIIGVFGTLRLARLCTWTMRPGETA
jgi:hypothetical protein